MQLVARAMRDEENDDTKKPHPLAIGRKGDNAAESREYGPREIGPDGKQQDGRYHHMHVIC
jgi:hypothetical protein